MMSIFAEGVHSGCESARRIKEQMDRELLDRNFEKFSWLTINFDGQLCVVSTGAVSPNVDFSGQEIQRLHDLDAEIQPLLFGIAATVRGGAAVFGWRPGHEAPRRFVDSLVQQGIDRLPNAIVEFMFTHIENTYFSEDWWRILTDGQREVITSHAVNFNPYYLPPTYAAGPLVPWNVISILREPNHLGLH